MTTEAEIASSTWQRLLDDLASCFPYLDLETWGLRWIVARSAASVPAVPGLAKILATPTLDDGKYVHEKIQGRFREFHGPTSARSHDLVIERRAFLRPDLKVSLEQAILYRRGNALYPWLWEAFKTKGSFRIGNLRTDMVDVDTMEIWEIKPLASIDDAVLQLARYVVRYNCLAQIARLDARRRPLTPGQSLDIRVLLPFAMPGLSDDGRARLAIPFELVATPGIITYVLVKLPKPEEVAAASAAAEALRRLFKQLRTRRWGPGVGPRPSDVPEWVLGAGLAAGVILAVAAIILTAPEDVAVVGGGAAVARGGQLIGRLLQTAGLVVPRLAFAQPRVQAGRRAVTTVEVDEPPALGLRTAFGTLPAESTREAIAALCFMATLFAILDEPE